MTAWFGEILVCASTIDKIERLKGRAEQRAEPSFSLAWRDGAPVRVVEDDAFREAHSAHVDGILELLSSHCEIVAATVPDDVDPILASIMKQFGADPIVAIYLSAEKSTLLVSEDQYFRNLAVSSARVSATWLQAFLLVAVRDAFVTVEDYAAMVVRLAYRRHNPVQFDLPVLLTVFQHSDTDLRDFEAACRSFGGPNALMLQHSRIAVLLLGEIRNSASTQRVQQATSIVLRALTRGREDWALWLGFLSVVIADNRRGGLQEYLFRWTRGHFLNVEKLRSGRSFWLRKLWLRANRAPEVSLNAMLSVAFPARWAARSRDTKTSAPTEHPQGQQKIDPTAKGGSRRKTKRAALRQSRKK